MRIKVQYFDDYCEACDFMERVDVVNYGVVPGLDTESYYVLYKQ